MRLHVWVFLIALGVPSTKAADIDALYDAIGSSDTQGVFDFVEEYYSEAGVSMNDLLTWESQPFDEIVNYYSTYDIKIVVSALSTPEQVAPYWDTWSQVLTQGAWDWQAFFRTPEEARIMSGFNQFLLAAHEMGHALTYRYDPYYDSRMDYEINCREYAADRLATALLQEVAAADPRLGALKARYGELIAEINANIAPHYRYVTPTFAELDADCRVMHVVQPDAETMTPYASAFFVRHALLQAADLPPLREMYETHLFTPWRDRLPPPSGLAGPVTTEGPVEGVNLEVQRTGLDVERQLLVFDPQGELYVVEYGSDDEVRPPLVRFSYGPAVAPLEIAVPATPLDGDWGEYDSLFIASAVALGPDRFLVLSGGIGFSVDKIWLFDLRRGPDGWTMSAKDIAVQPAPFAFLVFDAAGRVHVVQNEYIVEGVSDLHWRDRIYDLETGALTDERFVPDSGKPIVAIGPDGETFRYDDYQITIMGADGVERAFAGAKLQGQKDATDPLEAEFIRSSSEFLPLPGGGLRMIDYQAEGNQLVTRHIDAAE